MKNLYKIIAIVILFLILLGLSYMRPFKETKNPAKVQTIVLSQASPSARFGEVKVTMEGAETVQGSMPGEGVGELNYYIYQLKFEQPAQVSVDARLSLDTAETGMPNSIIVGDWTIRLADIGETYKSIILEVTPSKSLSGSAQPKILETKTFSCPGMEGFTFEYPVFEGWKVEGIEKIEGVDDACRIGINSPAIKSGVQVYKMLNTKIEGYGRVSEPQENQFGITYEFGVTASDYISIDTQRDNSDAFPPQLYLYKKDWPYRVKINLGEVIEKNDGFDRELFYQGVINSFRLSKPNTN